ncbi:hypothetical protein AYO38_04820 [bacterium SCGC AG-212-C10]|nr:hypothetical protein AYO38_04820 [bacterium SCGC AG-212-C10]
MNLAKNHLDIGVFTNNEEEMLAFWQREVGLPFEETLPLGNGNRQQRHGMNGSVFKLNASRDAVPGAALTGYRELLIARDGITQSRTLRDPDGNPVTLVAPGCDGIVGIGIRLAVTDRERSGDFFGRVLELERIAESAYRWGDTVLLLEDAQGAPSGEMRGNPGYRYITVQVRDVNEEHRKALERGATEGRAPVTLGETARISFLRDPDGNWIEVSQRASLTGPLSG